MAGKKKSKKKSKKGKKKAKSKNVLFLQFIIKKKRRQAERLRRVNDKMKQVCSLQEEFGNLAMDSWIVQFDLEDNCENVKKLLELKEKENEELANSQNMVLNDLQNQINFSRMEIEKIENNIQAVEHFTAIGSVDLRKRIKNLEAEIARANEEFEEDVVFAQNVIKYIVESSRKKQDFQQKEIRDDIIDLIIDRMSDWDWKLMRTNPYLRHEVEIHRRWTGPLENAIQKLKREIQEISPDSSFGKPKVATFEEEEDEEDRLRRIRWTTILESARWNIFHIRPPS